MVSFKSNLYGLEAIVLLWWKKTQRSRSTGAFHKGHVQSLFFMFYLNDFEIALSIFYPNMYADDIIN